MLRTAVAAVMFAALLPMVAQARTRPINEACDTSAIFSGLCDDIETSFVKRQCTADSDAQVDRSPQGRLVGDWNVTFHGYHACPDVAGDLARTTGLLTVAWSGWAYPAEVCNGLSACTTAALWGGTAGQTGFAMVKATSVSTDDLDAVMTDVQYYVLP